MSEISKDEIAKLHKDMKEWQKTNPEYSKLTDQEKKTWGVKKLHEVLNKVSQD